MKREDAAMGWYWTPWMTSWLWVEMVRLPVLPRSGPVYKTGASAARPSRSAAHERVADGTRGCEVKTWAHRELHPGLAD